MALSRTFRAVVAARTSGTHERIKVVTYNLLADKYATSGMHSYCPRPLLAWDKRRAALRAEIEQYDSDLLCLQEVEEDVFHQELQPWMGGRGFGGVFAVRQSPQKAPSPLEGVALFWRHSMFRVVAESSQALGASLEVVLGPEPPPGAAGCDLWGFCKEREEAVILVLLECTSSRRRIVAVATHLFWNPYYPDVKAIQAANLCHQVSRFMLQHCGTLDVPLVIGGDFNSLWRKWQSDQFDRVHPGSFLLSGVYQLLSTGCLPADHPHHPCVRRGLPVMSSATTTASPSPPSSSSPEGPVPQSPLQGAPLHACALNLQSMYLTAHGREPVLTTKTATFAGCLDYVWISSQHWAVVQTLSLPYDVPPAQSADAPVDLSQVTFPPIPNADFPSDHIAMGCLLELQPQA